ncbi:hypothetical protein [Candidatus Amarobacter glycogenicus]|uniref:hypothetical protein n=1 Tax=Candidatus Amarobacter glycogenicus TaxID=3140699 RepID=UPI0031CC721F
MALNSTALSFMRIGGTSVAGVLLIWFNIGSIYIITASVYVLVTITTMLMRFEGGATRRKTSEGASSGT